MLVTFKFILIWAQNYTIYCTIEIFCVILQHFFKIIRLLYMLRIAVQSKGRLFDDTMNLLSEADIKVSATKRTLLVQSSNFPLEVLYLRDDDIPQSVASGVADIGVVGENEFVERGMQRSSHGSASRSAASRWPFRRKSTIPARSGSKARK